jgi:hypothetical protein
MIRPVFMLATIALVAPVAAQTPVPTVRIGAFADAYYDWDRPPLVGTARCDPSGAS